MPLKFFDLYVSKKKTPNALSKVFCSIVPSGKLQGVSRNNSQTGLRFVASPFPRRGLGPWMVIPESILLFLSHFWYRIELVGYKRLAEFFDNTPWKINGWNLQKKKHLERKMI